VGRLFWKFFAFVWLAQLVVIIAVGSLFSLTNHRIDAAVSDVAAGPMAEGQASTAAEVLRYAGVGGLRNWSERARGHAVLVVDATGRDVLGRPVSLGVAAVHHLQKDRA
jgi:two-component system OmpR family sensor kinase